MFHCRAHHIHRINRIVQRGAYDHDCAMLTAMLMLMLIMFATNAAR